MKMKVLCAVISCVFTLALVALYFNRNATIWPSNPFPYFVGMFGLINNNSFSMVSENVYITRSEDREELIWHIENTHGVKFTEQLGTGFFFDSDKKHIGTVREIFFGFNVYELRITHFQ